MLNRNANALTTNRYALGLGLGTRSDAVRVRFGMGMIPQGITHPHPQQHPCGAARSRKPGAVAVPKGGVTAVPVCLAGVGDAPGIARRSRRPAWSWSWPLGLEREFAFGPGAGGAGHAVARAAVGGASPGRRSRSCARS
jgi:hypothetical protein